MSLNHGWVFLKAVEKLSQGSINIIGKPSSFGQEELSISETTILLGHIFKQFNGLD